MSKNGLSFGDGFFFWHIHTFDSATSFNDSGRCKAVNYSYCDVIFHMEVSLLLLRWFWEITSVLFLFSFCLCLLYVSGSRFSSLNINAWKYFFAFFWHEICLTSQGPHALRKNLCKSYSLCVCLHWFFSRTFLRYCFFKCILIFVSTCCHRHMSMEVSNVYVRMYIYLFTFLFICLFIYCQPWSCLYIDTWINSTVKQNDIKTLEIKATTHQRFVQKLFTPFFSWLELSIGGAWSTTSSCTCTVRWWFSCSGVSVT